MTAGYAAKQPGSPFPTTGHDECMSFEAAVEQSLDDLAQIPRDERDHVNSVPGDQCQ
jgi:hypothetical protein